jgi:radical SAM superfamily enzyme YgiQ (UPF0313 family)
LEKLKVLFGKCHSENKKMGILIHASMVFEFDNDTKDIFNETVRFLIKNKVSTVFFNVLTPYPGTKIFDDLKKKIV